MDIGEQKRVIVVEPEPLRAPQPLPPLREPEPVPAAEPAPAAPRQ
jgi:hypothetical protein